MFKHPVTKTLLIAGIGLLTSAQVMAAWQFDPDHSKVNASFIDQRSSGDVTSVYHINQLNGSIDDQGKLSLPLELSQLDLLDKIPTWLTGMLGDQKAMVTGQVDPKWFDIDQGQSITKDVALTVGSGHHSHTETVPLKMTRTSDTQYHIETARPLALHTQDLMKQQYSGTIMKALGFQNLKDNIPLELDAQLSSTNQ